MGSLLDVRSSDAVYETIRTVLGGMVGENIASSSPRALARKLGFDGPQLTADQTASLVEQLCQELVVFVGHHRAAAARREIEERLAEGECLR